MRRFEVVSSDCDSQTKERDLRGESTYCMIVLIVLQVSYGYSTCTCTAFRQPVALFARNKIQNPVDEISRGTTLTALTVRVHQGGGTFLRRV